MSSQRRLNASALNVDESPGGVTVPVDHAVFSSVSGVSLELVTGAENREWKRLRIFDFSARKSKMVQCLIPRRTLRKPSSLLGLRAAFRLPNAR